MSVKAPFVDAEGKRAGEVELASEIFDVQVNVPVMHEVVRAQLAAARSGTHSTKTRAEVRGGGRKPWRQKGTGRARHGSIREPSWVGGGVAHGPKPRDHSMRINRKTRALALRSALSDRAREGKVLVVDVPDFAEPETKRAVRLLKDWDAQGKTLFVIGRDQEEELINAWKSFRNLPEVLLVTYPTAYTVLAAETVVFTKPALAALTSSGDAVTSSTSDADAHGANSPAKGSKVRQESAADVSSTSASGTGESVAAATSSTSDADAHGAGSQSKGSKVRQESAADVSAAPTGESSESVAAVTSSASDAEETKEEGGDA